MGDLAVGLLVILGSLLVLLAGAGVVRFTDVYARMHAATKVPTLGILLIAVAAAIALEGGRSKLVLTVAFILITAPSAAHLVGRAAYRAEGIEIDVEARDDLAAALDEPPDPSGDPAP